MSELLLMRFKKYSCSNIYLSRVHLIKEKAFNYKTIQINRSSSFSQGKARAVLYSCRTSAKIHLYGDIKEGFARSK